MEPLNLREQMKRETSRVIARAAQDLVRDRGLGAVTVKDIAMTAGVSERTFFNYFSCKEEAVIGVPWDLLVELDAALRSRPRSEGPFDALRAVLTVWMDQEAILTRWGLRYELVDTYPALLPQYLAALFEIEAALSRTLAERMGVDPADDPSPRVLVAAVLAALRAGISWWEESGRRVPVSRVCDRAFDQVVSASPPAW